MVYLDEENSAAAPAACQSRPAFPSHSDCSSTCGTTEETLKASLLFLPVTLDLCLGFFFFLSPPPVCKDEREGVDRERGRQINWKHPRVQQPYATDQNMGFKGVCVLLGVLLLVNTSFQQQGRRKPLKKGTVQHVWITI